MRAIQRSTLLITAFSLISGLAQAATYNTLPEEAHTKTAQLQCASGTVVQITEATYGKNRGAPQNNAKSAMAKACDGTASCHYTVDYRLLGDPAPNQTKDFYYGFDCVAAGQNSKVSVASEASGKVAALSCSAGYGVTVDSAIYGGNCNTPGNVTSQVASACNGKTDCSYKVDHTVIGDPAPGCPKDFTVNFQCQQKPLTFKLYNSQAQKCLRGMYEYYKSRDANAQTNLLEAITLDDCNAYGTDWTTDTFQTLQLLGQNGSILGCAEEVNGILALKTCKPNSVGNIHPEQMTDRLKDWDSSAHWLKWMTRVQARESVCVARNSAGTLITNQPCGNTAADQWVLKRNP